MELPAYHYGQQDTSLDDNLYEEIDTTKHLSTTREKVQDPVREKTKPSTAKKTGGKQRGLNVSKAGYSTFLEVHLCVTISLVSNDEIPCNFRGK